MARSPHHRRKALYLGHLAEWIVIVLLALKGYRILARRYRSKGGEIDIIALRGRVIAFVEVKARRNISTGLDALSHEKIRRFSLAVDHWLIRNSWAATYVLRCDAVIVLPYQLPHHVEDAFALPLG